MSFEFFQIAYQIVSNGALKAFSIQLSKLVSVSLWPALA